MEADIYTVEVKYIPFRPKGDVKTDVEALLLPPYLCVFKEVPQYISIVNGIRIIKPGSTDLRNVEIDEQATLEERARIMQRSPRLMCFGCNHIRLHVKTNGNGSIDYVPWDGSMIEPESEEDYVFGMRAACIYIQVPNYWTLEKRTRKNNVPVFGPGGPGERFYNTVTHFNAFLLSDLNRMMTGNGRGAKPVQVNPEIEVKIL